MTWYIKHPLQPINGEITFTPVILRVGWLYSIHTHTIPPLPPPHPPPEMGKDKLTYSYYFTNLLEIINCCLFLPQASVLFQFYFSTFIFRHSQPPSSDLHDLCIFSTWVSSVFHRGSLRPHRAERVHLPFCCSGTGKLLTCLKHFSLHFTCSFSLWRSDSADLRHEGEIPAALKKIYSCNNRDGISSVSLWETARKGKREQCP